MLHDHATVSHILHRFINKRLQSNGSRSKQLYTRGICHIFPVCWASKQQPALHSRNMSHISCVLGITASITLEEYATYFVYAGHQSSNQHYSRGICHIFPVCWASQPALHSRNVTHFLCAGYRKQQPASHSRNIPHIWCVLGITASITLEEYATYFLVLGIANSRGEEYATYFLCAEYHNDQKPTCFTITLPYHTYFTDVQTNGYQSMEAVKNSITLE